MLTASIKNYNLDSLSTKTSENASLSNIVSWEEETENEIIDIS